MPCQQVCANTEIKIKSVRVCAHMPCRASKPTYPPSPPTQPPYVPASLCTYAMPCRQKSMPCFVHAAPPAPPDSIIWGVSGCPLQPLQPSWARAFIAWKACESPQ
eukprot:1139110-Pelagomonas_calceolata.AAC.4